MELKGQGKLLKSDNNMILSEVEYNIFVEPGYNGSEKWQGEMIPTDNIKIIDGGEYLMETEDGRRGLCFLRKQVNKAVMGIPVRYYYHLNGGTLPK